MKITHRDFGFHCCRRDGFYLFRTSSFDLWALKHVKRSPESQKPTFACVETLRDQLKCPLEWRIRDQNLFSTAFGSQYFKLWFNLFYRWLAQQACLLPTFSPPNWVRIWKYRDKTSKKIKICNCHFWNFHDCQLFSRTPTITENY